MAIPMLNAESHLERLLDALRQQKGVDLRLLVIDSSSADETNRILETAPGLSIEVHSIPRESFSHGGTRQMMVEMCTTEAIIFLTQDAVPSHPEWAISHVRALSVNPQIAAVVGRQIPERWAPASTGRRIDQVFLELGGHSSLSLFADQLHEPAQSLSFLSNCNTSYKTSILRQFPIPPVAYAEDQAIALLLKAQGYWLAYSQSASVVHTNKLSVRSLYQRQIDESIGLFEAIGVAPNTQPLAARFVIFLRDCFRDTAWLSRQRGGLGRVRKFLSIWPEEVAFQLASMKACRAISDMKEITAAGTGGDSPRKKTGIGFAGKKKSS